MRREGGREKEEGESKVERIRIVEREREEMGEVHNTLYVNQRGRSGGGEGEGRGRRDNRRENWSG